MAEPTRKYYRACGWSCWLGCWLILGTLAAKADAFDTLRIYWQNYLITNAGSASSVASTANSYWSSMNTGAGRTSLWNDLPLGSVSANLVSTYQRLQAMATAWAMPGNSLQNNASLAAAVADGLDWMNANAYTTATVEYNNWFHWEISGPQALNNTAVLLYPALSGTQITNYLAAVDRFSPGGTGATYGWMTGANTADKVLVVAIRGILGRNAGKLSSAQTNLSIVFPYVTSGDGFYPDGSFVFHGNIAYNGHYGLVLLGDIPKLVNLLQGSTWQITDPNLTNVYNWVSNSFIPFVYHGSMMDMVRGRAISWSYETAANDGAGTISAVRQIGQFAPATLGGAFSNWAANPVQPLGQFHFPAMDRVVAVRTNFTLGLSLSSSRIANYESINSGNLHGWFTGDGMTYLYQGASDTQFNGHFWPTVDPYHLPGTTVQTNSHANSAGQATTTDQNWVGGAQLNQSYGAAGMSLHAWNTSLYAKKSWFMLDNEIICLGAGITCGGPAEVHTTADNRRLGSTLTNAFQWNSQTLTPTLGWSTNLSATSGTAIYLAGIGGYFVPAGYSNAAAVFQTTSGAWSQINSGDDSTVYTDNYFKLWFNHGLQPTNSRYAYTLLPGASAATVSNYALAPATLILTNTPTLQAVKKPALGLVAANFWTAGTQSADLITAANPLSVMTLENTNTLSVALADPTQTNSGTVSLTLNRAVAGIVSADPAITVQQLSPKVMLSANVNGARGRSLQAVFNYSNSILPTISAGYPDGTRLEQSTNTFSFTVTAPAGCVPTGVTVLLNGNALTNLIFTGTSNLWQVAYPGLAPNTSYTATVTVTDTYGNTTSWSRSFDTFSAQGWSWEAEDYDYGGGQFLAQLQTNAYAGLRAITNVDARQVNFAGTFLYRPNGMDTEVNGDLPRSPYTDAGLPDYSLSYFSPGSWVNYTRRFPAGSYLIFARLAAGGGATACTLWQVTAGWGTTNQTTNWLGTFNVPNTAWETYNYIPLKAAAGNPVIVSFTGSTNTLRLTRPATVTGDCNANFLLLVPVFALTSQGTPTNLTLTFPTQSGFRYQVQYKANLADEAWLNLTDWPGNDTRQTFTESPTNQNRFYRVLIH